MPSLQKQKIKRDCYNCQHRRVCHFKQELDKAYQAGLFELPMGDRRINADYGTVLDAVGKSCLQWKCIYEDSPHS